MTKVFSKLLSIISLFAILLLITGCLMVKIEKVELKTNLSGEICVTDFKLSDIKLLITYDDNSINYDDVDESMLSKEDLDKLATVGTHNITINYKGVKVNATVNLVEDPNPPVTEVRLNVDNKKYTVEALDTMYTATCSHDSQYVYIIVKVTLLIGYTFNEEGIELYVNDTLIDPSKYTIEDNVITYKYKDPNWSPIL